MMGGDDFESFAKAALGTDDPERLTALKEAIMACMAKEEAGEYEEGSKDMGKGEMSMLFGGGG